MADVRIICFKDPIHGNARFQIIDKDRVTTRVKALDAADVTYIRVFDPKDDKFSSDMITTEPVCVMCGELADEAQIALLGTNWECHNCGESSWAWKHDLLS